MDKNQMSKAIDNILPIVATLTECEWKRIDSLINWHYASKAAKVTLDGNDIKALTRNLKLEILGESPKD